MSVAYVPLDNDHLNSHSKSVAWLKQHGPTALMVISAVTFMNAKDALSAIIAGLFAVAGIIWVRLRGRSGAVSLGEPVMTLGALYAEPPQRMRPWHFVGLIAFLLMGTGSLLAMTEADWPIRFAMCMISYAICGTWLILLSRRNRAIGLMIFGGGFALAGASFCYGGYIAFVSGDEAWQMNLVRSLISGGFLLLVGVGSVIQVFRKRGETHVYESGVPGPHGMAPFENAERLELIEIDGLLQLAISAYSGWTLWVDVPEDMKDQVSDLITQHRSQPSAM